MQDQTGNQMQEDCHHIDLEQLNRQKRVAIFDNLLLWANSNKDHIRKYTDECLMYSRFWKSKNKLSYTDSRHRVISHYRNIKSPTMYNSELWQHWKNLKTLRNLQKD